MPNGLPAGKASQIYLLHRGDIGGRRSHAGGLNELQKVQAKERVRIDPNLNWLPATPFGQGLKALNCVFVGVLGMDPLTRRECEALSKEVNSLIGQTLKINFYAPLPGLVERAVCETRGIETALKLPVHPGQKIKAKGRGDAFCVVVGGYQNVEALLKVDANQKRTSRAQELCRIP